MSISKRTASIICIPVATWILSVAVAELGFRVVGKRTSDDQAGLYRAFGAGGYKHAAHVATTANWYTGKFYVYTDALGLRCGKDGRGAIAAGDYVDYLLLGDSQTFSSGVPYEQSLGGAFQAAAAKQGQTVANAAVSGHLLRNQIEMARWLREDQNVQMGTIVLMVTPHLMDAVPSYSRAHVAEDGRLYERAPGMATRARTWLKTHSSTYIAVRDATRSVATADLDLPKVVSFYDTRGEVSDRARELRALVEELQTWAAAGGSKLLLAYTALPMEAAFDDVEAIARTVEVEVSPDASWNVASHVGHALGIPLLDLRPALEEVKASGQPLQLEGDPFYHYNAVTSQKCGKLLWGELSSLLAHDETHVAVVEKR